MDVPVTPAPVSPASHTIRRAPARAGRPGRGRPLRIPHPARFLSLYSQTAVGAGQERPRHFASSCELKGKMVGTARFELATPCTPSKCATRLRHVPTGRNPPLRILPMKSRELPAEGFTAQFYTITVVPLPADAFLCVQGAWAAPHFVTIKEFDFPVSRETATLPKQGFDLPSCTTARIDSR